MPAEIWNQGRVVGLSAYEVYVKQHLAEDPNTPVASEREWLASSLAMGSSMLAKLPNLDVNDEDLHSYIDIFFPENSALAAANTIVASFFDGDAEFNNAICKGMTQDSTTTDLSGGGWAKKITDYGQCISNVTSLSPQDESGPLTDVPSSTLEDWTRSQKDKLRDYMKIVDGIVIHPGSWQATNTGSPHKDLQPKLNEYPRIRIHVKGSISKNPLILFTGFTIRSILLGTVGTAGSTNTSSPQNGDFLGPGVFPWSNKIVFSVPTSYIVYFASGAYKRKINPDNPSGLLGDEDFIRVSDTPVIDMKSKSGDRSLDEPVLENYYSSSRSTDTKFYEATNTSEEALDAKKSSRIPDNVSDFTTLGDGTSVLTVYSKKAVFPPALYGTFVGSEGSNFLHPIDIVAPGSVKMFYNDDGTSMQEYQDTFEGTTAINKTEDGTLEVLDPSDPTIKVPVSDLQLDFLHTGSGPDFVSPTDTLKDDDRPKIIKIKSGKKAAYALSMSKNIGRDNNDPTQEDISTKPSTTIPLDNSNSSDNISWSALLHALEEDKGVDILGDRLKSAKYTLQKPNTGSVSETDSQKKDTSRGSSYIEFGPEGSAIRLYIAKEQPNPANVPVGSIGIGWGFES